MVHTQQKHLVLVGFMGTGKSTVSRVLAQRLGCPAVDIDTEIVRREGRPIADIFAQQGEAAFRAAETAALTDVLRSGLRQVVATGGGAVLAPANRELMLAHGYVVALKAEPEQIIGRVREDSSRPLLQGDLRERVYKLLEEREHAYDFAHCTVDTTRLGVDEVVERIMEGYGANQPI